MNIRGNPQVQVTGTASGIGQAVGFELAEHGAGGRAGRPQGRRYPGRADDQRPDGDPLAEPMIGDATDEDFRRKIFDHM